MTLTRARTIQYVGILFSLLMIAAGYWYFSVRAGVKTNTSGSQPGGSGDLSAGLVGYWKLDENTGTSAADSSANVSSGTLTNGPTWTTGQIGSAVNFDGTNDYITDPGATAVDFGGSTTLAAWVKLDTLPVYGGNSPTIIFNDTASGHYYRLQLVDLTDGAQFIQLNTGSGGNNDYSAALALSTGTWYHVAATYNPQSDVASFYLNGGFVGTAVDTVSGGYVSDAGTLYFGSTDTGDRLDGQLDEIRIYDRTLSADEVAALARLTAPTDVDTSLKGYWSFNSDALSGTTAFDRSGVGNHGTLTGGPAAVEGRVGQALSYDNVDDYVLAGSPTAVDNLETQGGGGLTASAWIYPESGGTFGGVIVGKRAAPSPGSGDWAFTMHQDGDAIKFYKSYSTTSLEATTVAGSIALNKWQYVTVTWNGGATRSSVSFYIDGVLVPTSTSGGSDGVGTKDSDASSVVSISSQFLQFDGRIDEVRLHNRILSASEVKSLYDRGAPDTANTSASQAQGTGNLDSGLAGYWKLDENTGTSAGDASTNGNTGTLTSGPTWTTGRIGSAVNFDGTNDYISVGDQSVLEGGNRLTISAWVNASLISGTEETIVSKEGVYKIDIAAWTGNKVRLLTGNNSEWGFNDLTSTTAISTGTWYHIVGTYDGAEKKLYINGTLEDVATSTGDLPTNAVSAYIGAYDSGSPDGFFPGLIDELRIYNRALTSDEVANLYRRTTPTSVDTNLKGYWSFNGQDSSGTVAYDLSGAGNTATLTSGPSITEGRVGQALDFDGSNDYLSYANTIAFNSSDFTVTAWVMRDGTGGGTDAINPIFVQRVDSVGTGNPSVGLTFDASHLANFSVRDNVGDSATATSTVATPTGVWSHVVGVKTSTQVLLYVDGVLTATASHSLSGDFDAGVVYRHIGKHRYGGADTAFYNGKIDEVRVYTRALSAVEIKAQYDASAPDKTNTSVSTPQGTGRLDSGLAGYWKLDENTGTSASDSSVNGNAGTLTNGPTWTTGQIGSAVSFDGSNDYITVSDNAVYAPKTISAFAWIKRSASNGRIFSKDNGIAQRDFQLKINSSNNVEFTVWNQAGSPTTVNGGSTVDTNWHLVGGTWDGATIRTYLDGVEQNSGALSGTSVFNGSDPLEIGRYSFDTEYFNGFMDELRLYDRVLSIDEIVSLYRLTSPTGTDTGLKGYWSFNGQDMSGTTAYDRSGSGNNGTLTNGPTVIEGKLGQALSFDAGGNDGVVIAGDTYDNLSVFSVSAWTNLAGYGAARGYVAGKSSGYLDDGWTLYSYTTFSELVFEVDYTTTNLFVGVPLGSSDFNEWVHWTVTWDGTVNASGVHFYRNGVEISHGSNQSASGTRVSDASNSLILGGNTADRGVDGKLDELRIYNRVVTAAEAKALYSSGK